MWLGFCSGEGGGKKVMTVLEGVQKASIVAAGCGWVSGLVSGKAGLVQTGASSRFRPLIVWHSMLC